MSSTTYIFALTEHKKCWTSARNYGFWSKHFSWWLSDDILITNLVASWQKILKNIFQNYQTIRAYLAWSRRPVSYLKEMTNKWMSTDKNFKLSNRSKCLETHLVKLCCLSTVTYYNLYKFLFVTLLTSCWLVLTEYLPLVAPGWKKQQLMIQRRYIIYPTVFGTEPSPFGLPGNCLNRPKLLTLA